MTRITLHRRLILSMTLDTISHRQIDLLCNHRHRFDIAMAFFTSDPFGDMPTMVEIDKIGHIVDPNPFKRISLFNQCLHFLNVRAVRFDQRMTIHASLHARNRSDARFVNAGVTILARDIQIPRMELVAERNRLCRRITDIVPNVPKKINNAPHQNEQRQWNDCFDERGHRNFEEGFYSQSLRNVKDISQSVYTFHEEPPARWLYGGDTS